MNLSTFSNFLKRYDFSFFGMGIVIFILGALNLYSATYSSGNDILRKQIIYFSVSLLIGVIVSFIRPKTVYRYSYFIYTINLILLILVNLIGTKSLGAQRWLVLGPLRIQPSEFMKIASVLALARWYSKHNPDKSIGLKEIIVPFLIAFIPALSIIIEPDLGTGLVILLIFFVITFYRRLKWKTIFILCFIGLFSGVLMYNYGLKEYQRQRIKTFLDPWGDARGSGYNAIQSEIAIGSGQLFGKGFRNSSQASLNYLPENHTDFVFSIYNEEHGFFGSVVLITLYTILLLRFIWLSTSVLNFFDSIVSMGLMAIFFWHTFVNMGMVTGLLPIVGLPLPFMSYGGSSLVTFAICCGIITSISNSRKFF